jgi:hypothetical protein
MSSKKIGMAFTYTRKHMANTNNNVNNAPAPAPVIYSRINRSVHATNTMTAIIRMPPSSCSSCGN